MRLSLGMFGPMHVTSAGRPVAFATQATRALLAYLAVEADRPHPREALSALLWPDQPQAAAYSNLRQTLARLRKALADVADEALRITPQTLQFNRDVAEIDALTFEALLADCAVHSHGDISTLVPVWVCPDCIERLKEATALYRGEFLGGMSLDESPAFSEWLLFKREQLHRQALDAMHALARHYETMGDWERMRRTAARQLELEPWREEAHAQLMRALALSGQRVAALAQYEGCAQTLQREFGIEPDIELRALADRIRADDAALGARLPRHNLPEQLTAFIGRERELAEIASRLAQSDARLLTLVGAGGMGKTRLAIEAGRARLVDYPDGVFFVSLASLADPTAIAPAIASVIGANVQGDPERTLLQSIRDKRLLLVLDNFEHLLNDPRIVVRILQAASHVHIVATSREPLNVRGEHVVAVQGMDYQTGAVRADTESPSAVRLFTLSARRAQPGFTPTEANLPCVLRICQLVDGMPLGLELAAAWVGAMPLDDVAGEIEKSVDFLAANWHDAPERQRSMRAVFEWSWNLLNEDERRVLRRLSVFRGGFTRAAAEAVAGASLGVLTSLVRKSLVRLAEHRTMPASGWYATHELLRQFAAEKLTQSDGDGGHDDDTREHDETRKRHGEYFVARVGTLATAMHSTVPQMAIAEIQANLDNIRQACAWAIEHEHLRLLHDHAPSLSSIYNLLGLFQEGERLMQRLARLAEGVLARVEPVDQVDLTWAAALAAKSLVEQARYLVTNSFPQQASQVAQRALAYARQAGDVDSEAGALFFWGESSMDLGDVEQARHLLAQALDRMQSAPPYHAPQPGRGTPVLKPMLLAYLAIVAVRQNRDGDAREYGEQSLRLCIDAGDSLGKARVLTNLGAGHGDMGRYVQARDYQEQALLLVDQFPNSLYYIRVLQELGRILLYCGDYDGANLRFQQALTRCRDMGDGLSEARILSLLSRLACYRDAHETARSTGVQGSRLAREWGNRHVEATNLCSLGEALVGLERLDEAAAAYHQALTLFDALGDTSTAVEPEAGLAGIALAQGDPCQAQAHVDKILNVLEANPRAGLDEPFAVYLACYRVLEANHDPRAATLLRAAQTLLRDYAGHIKDDALRRTFLEHVPAHRELHQLAVETNQRLSVDSFQPL